MRLPWRKNNNNNTHTHTQWHTYSNKAIPTPTRPHLLIVPLPGPRIYNVCMWMWGPVCQGVYMKLRERPEVSVLAFHLGDGVPCFLFWEYRVSRPRDLQASYFNCGPQGLFCFDISFPHRNPGIISTNSQLYMGSTDTDSGLHTRISPCT